MMLVVSVAHLSIGGVWSDYFKHEASPACSLWFPRTSRGT